MQRCKAESKRSKKRCKNYAVKGWSVCRMHGARGGPNTKEGLSRCRNASLKHGFYKLDAITNRQKTHRIATRFSEINKI